MRIPNTAPGLLSLFLLCGAHSQTLTSSPGVLDPVAVGLMYVLDADPRGNLTPAAYGESGYPARFVLRSDAGDRWRIEFRLPSYLLGSDSLFCEFSRNGAFVEEDQTTRDPHEPLILTAGNDSSIAIDLGIIAHVPARPVRGDTYRGTIVCRATRLSDSLPVVDSTSFVVVSTCGLGPDQNADGELDNLSPGKTYTLSVRPRGISPIVNGQEAGSPVIASLDYFDPGLAIIVTCSLPDSLRGENSLSLPCWFSSTSALDQSTGELWDPHLPHGIVLDTTGSRLLEVGITLSVPESTPPGSYSGVILWHLRFGGDSGITTSDFAQVVVASVVGGPIPEQFALGQNYPNPFNGSTTITYDLPLSAPVRLTLVNALGEVVRILDDRLAGAGTQVIRVEADGLASGIYFYRMTSGPYTAVRKMCILR